MNQIRIGIFGYGNLGKGVELAAMHSDDISLQAVFTRRDPAAIQLADPCVPVVSSGEVAAWKEKIDVLIVCGGSAKDLPTMTPELAKQFCVVDSFDTHAKIPEHFAAVDAAAELGGNLALISCGWDPGLFSLARLMGDCVLPHGNTYTFWGKGVSQGHSDAIRHIPGVADARQYTIPCDAVMDAVRSNDCRSFTAQQMHTRECFVVLEPGADADAVRNEIVTMPDYFAGYDTTVHFISQEEFDREHRTFPHGGTVIRNGCCGRELENHATIEYSLKLDSNPEFTAGVLVAYARAIHRMHKRGSRGCISIFDVAPADLSPRSPEELRAHLL